MAHFAVCCACSADVRFTIHVLLLSFALFSSNSLQLSLSFYVIIISYQSLIGFSYAFGLIN